MNCRRARKMLPELVAGELDEIAAKRAMGHMDLCQACASEKAKYEEFLGALARPREMVEPPEALSTIRLPEPRRRAVWPRLVLLTPALAGLVVLAIWLPLRNMVREEIAASRSGAGSARVARKGEGGAHAPAPVKVAQAPQVKPANPVAYGQPRQIERRHAAVSIQPRGRVQTPPVVRRERPDTPVAAQEQSRPPEPRYPQIIVVAYKQPVKRSAIEIRCVNEVTGETVTYHEISDSTGSRIVIENKSVPKNSKKRSAES